MNEKMTLSSPAQKKTFNIDVQNIRGMESFIAPRKQTEFVNKAIKFSLDQMRKEQAKQEAIASLEALYNMRSDADMDDSKDSVELIREIRHERVNR